MHTHQHLFDKNKNYKNTTGIVQKKNNTLNNCKNTNEIDSKNNNDMLSGCFIQS